MPVSDKQKLIDWIMDNGKTMNEFELKEKIDDYIYYSDYGKEKYSEGYNDGEVDGYEEGFDVACRQYSVGEYKEV